MALQIANISEIKEIESAIKDAKNNYDEALKNLKNAVSKLDEMWKGQDADVLRNKINELVNNEFTETSNELEFEINYLSKIAFTLQNAQEQIRSRLVE